MLTLSYDEICCIEKGCPLSGDQWDWMGGSRFGGYDWGEDKFQDKPRLIKLAQIKERPLQFLKHFKFKL